MVAGGGQGGEGNGLVVVMNGGGVWWWGFEVEEVEMILMMMLGDSERGYGEWCGQSWLTGAVTVPELGPCVNGGGRLGVKRARGRDEIGEWMRKRKKGRRGIEREF